MQVFQSADELVAATGREIGRSSWQTITQDRISAFADITGDHQWIHTDPLRAAEGPFGRTIAHGYLTLSLGPSLCADVYRIANFKNAVNYGLDRVRFLHPVLVDSDVSGRVRFEQVDVAEDGAITAPSPSRCVTRIGQPASRPLSVATTSETR